MVSAHTGLNAGCAFVLTRVIIAEDFFKYGITLPKIMNNFEAFIHITELPSEEIVTIDFPPGMPICVPAPH